MKRLLEGERQERYVGVPEFAVAAARHLAELGLVQERGTVTDVPDERTIRYYLSEGLIQPAEKKQGTASVFSYLHLLQLLVVKKLQADHLPIRKIRELVAGRNERQLERLLGVGSGARPEAAETRGTSGEQKAKSGSRHAETSGFADRQMRASAKKRSENDAMRYLESLLTRPSPSQAAAPGRPSAAAKPMYPATSPGPAAGETKSWARIEVEPGLELHIRSDYRAPVESGKKERLAERIAKFIKKRR
jgi:DNA-binding transcriptional MerR regulator